MINDFSVAKSFFQPNSGQHVVVVPGSEGEGPRREDYLANSRERKYAVKEKRRTRVHLRNASRRREKKDNNRVPRKRVGGARSANHL